MSDCPIYQAQVSESWRDADLHLGVGGFVVESKFVCTRDVPGDFDCLFHCLGREYHSLKLGPGADNAESAQGTYWRNRLVELVSNADARVDGMLVRELLAACGEGSPDAYCSRLLTESRPWGGFLEVTLVSALWESLGARGLAVGFLAVRQERDKVSYQCISVIGAKPDDTRHLVFLAWTGNHFMRARLREPALRQIEAWRREAD
jgi:hypothetical protein